MHQPNSQSNDIRNKMPPPMPVSNSNHGYYYGYGSPPANLQQPQPQPLPLPPTQPNPPPPLHHHQPPVQHQILSSGLSPPGYHQMPGQQYVPHQQPPHLQQPNPSPSNIPNPLRIVEEERGRFRDGPFFTSHLLTRTIPPRSSVSSSFFDDLQIIDDGMSSSRFVRSTCWTLPQSEELAGQLRLPVGLSFQPFAILPSHEPPVPVLDFGPGRGPIRCLRCRGYINPYVIFVRGGRSWQCNLCGALNEVAEEYYAPLDAAGRRVDATSRPELRCGTIDIVAGAEYNMRPVVGPARLLFLVDASRAAVHSGAFKASIEAVRVVFKSPDAHRLYSHFALATFDRSIHFYDLREEPLAMVMGDLSDPFLPISPSALFVPSNSVATSVVDRFLNGLVALFAETRIVESSLGAAASVALDALKDCGGRVFVLASTLPSIGLGGLKIRNEANAVPTDKANPLLAPQSDYYQRLATRAVSLALSFSLFLTPSAYIDVASLGPLAGYTGGYIQSYNRFSFETLGGQLVEDVLMAACRPFVYDCMVRVRCGEGLQTHDYYGPCPPSPPGSTSRADVQFGALSCDQSFAVTLQYDGRLVEGDTTGIQCAILHTCPSTGQRRIRVINLALPSSKQPQDIFRTCDFEAIASVISKQTIAGQISKLSAAMPLSQLSNALFSRTSQLLAAYRKVAASNVSPSQLILPEELRLLPLILLSLVKGVAFAPSTATSDARMLALRALCDLPNDLLFHYFYPRLMPLLSLPDTVGVSGIVPLCRLTRDSLDRQGMYLLGIVIAISH